MRNPEKRSLIVLLLFVITLSVFLYVDLSNKYKEFHGQLDTFHGNIKTLHEKAKAVYKRPSGEKTRTKKQKPRRSHSRHFYPSIEQDRSIILNKESVTYPFTFIAYGDSREPAGYEKEVIITKIITEKPSFVVHVGDMVAVGEARDWEGFDIAEARIINKGIPFYPVLGNHEYHTRMERYPDDPTKQLDHYFKRFSFLGKRRWYAVRYGNSMFVILDTNTDYSPGSYQYQWLLGILKNESPNFLFIFMHRPPYTKNKYGNHKAEKILSDLFESHAKNGLLRADIVFAGHSHNYERYKNGGINYIVSGGGGAGQHSLARDQDDFYTVPGKNFHYCKITVSEDDAVFEMIRLDRQKKTWKIFDYFVLKK